MPVILMDPALPDLIPARGVAYLAGHVFVTEDVHPRLLWDLPSYEYVSFARDLPPRAVVLSSDRTHPLVRQEVARGEEVITADALRGTRLLEAVALMDRLRRTGPWEKQQTHDSLRRYLLEEVYELLDTFDRVDADEMRSELGDLLLQVLFHARIAEDAAQGAFTIDDVAQSFIDKVSYRTPGVLSGEHADLERQIQEWEDRKAAERSRGSVLDGLVTSQPVLALTQKLFERLVAADFPRNAISPSLTRIDIPIRRHARDSVEDSQRRLVMQLMSDVRAAENAAGIDGVIPRDENTWRKYLGMSYDETVIPAQPVEQVSSQPVEPVRSEATSRVETPPDDRALHDDRAESRSPSPPVTNEVTSCVETPAPVDAETTGQFRPVRVAAPSTDPRAYYFEFPKPGERFDFPDLAEHRAAPEPEPAPSNDFPEPDDFPGPPPKYRTVDVDPHAATEREVDVSYGSDVPQMVIRHEWDDEDD
ncbi:MazG nucleotide pyrophosphohydrolase domain-containing protein [Gordonia sp. (in: high G+C Gram-positive bacteria)]|uniref:MazG family protein n=1 Tax=Gordonia sp. (in: high G+C Gram-positive bacteria) TaxID=84139 RepID=UPI00352745FE